MKKLITYIKRFIICFSLVAYIFPTLCASICSFRYIVNSNATVSAKENKKEFSAHLLNNSSTETLNEDNVEKFADTIFNQELKRFNVPGAVLSVVKDNHVLFEKGYGYSDIDKKTPVNFKTTVFRAASISKLFTATAVMQLKENKETSPLLFKNVMGNSLTFITNKQGKISYMLNAGSNAVMNKIHWYENPTLHKIIFVFFLVLFLSIAIGMILFNLKNRNNKKPLIFKYHRWVIAFICILNLVFLIGMAKECITLLSSLIFLTELPKAAIYLLMIPIITTILTLGLMISICLYWYNKKSNLGTIIPNILICCIFLAFTLYLNYWNLLEFKF